MTKRKYEPIARHEGVYRILVFDEKLNRWIEPDRGAKFAVRKRFVDLNGKAKNLNRHFESIADAKKFRGSVTQVAAGVPEQDDLKEQIDGKKLKFYELVEEWKRNWLPHKAVSTKIRYLSYIQHFNYFSDFVVENIEPTDIDGWITYLKKPEYLKQHHSTRCDYRHEFSVLRQILGFYASRFNRNYRLPFLPEHRKMAKVKEKPEIKKDLNLQEFEKFLKALGETVLGTKYAVVYYISLMQYAIYGRLQDVAALHYEDFNFTRNELTINKKVIWPRAKGYEPFIECGSKVGGGRVLPLSDLARKIFREWVMHSGVRTGLLFSFDEKILTYRQIEHRYTEALKQAGLPFQATHILRHASLTEFYDTCKDLLQTQKVAGHSSTKTTEKYAKVRDDRIVQTQLAMDVKLSGLFSGAEVSSHGVVPHGSANRPK